MSQAHSDKFSEMEENVHKWFDKISKKEENVHRLFLQVFTKRSKMSNGHSDIISQKGVKCPSVILAIFKNHLDSGRKKSFFLGELSLG